MSVKLFAASFEGEDAIKAGKVLLGSVAGAFSPLVEVQQNGEHPEPKTLADRTHRNDRGD